MAVALLNRGGGSRYISTSLSEIGLGSGTHTYRELWTGATGTTGGQFGAQVPEHGVALYKVTPGGDPTDPPSSTSLVSASSGRCLDVPNSDTTNGTGLVIWDCHSAANQTWTQDGGTLRALGKCLDAPLNATAGDLVQLWDCNGGDNQRWTFESNGTIRNVRSGLCLDVDHNRTANNTAVLLWTRTGAANQIWSRG